MFPNGPNRGIIMYERESQASLFEKTCLPSVRSRFSNAIIYRYTTIESKPVIKKWLAYTHTYMYIYTNTLLHRNRFAYAFWNQFFIIFFFSFCSLKYYYELNYYQTSAVIFTHDFSLPRYYRPIMQHQPKTTKPTVIYSQWMRQILI